MKRLKKYKKTAEQIAWQKRWEKHYQTLELVAKLKSRGFFYKLKNIQ